jgi:long-chain acyl-CoA synthetase
MVISGGVNIYPAEIEAMLHAVPGVMIARCSAFRMPSSERR